MLKTDNNKLSEFQYLATTRCNCRCKHCYPGLYTGKDHEMSSQELISYYENSSFLKTNSVSVAGGEPFVKEDIDDFIVYLDHKKIPCIITTNGYFTERIGRLLDKLEDCNTVRFSVSIDGIAEVHDRIRGIKGCYERALASAMLIKSKGFLVQINMVAQKDNIADIPRMKGYFKDLNIPLNIIPKINTNREEKFEFNAEQIREVYPYMSLPREKKLLLSKGEYVIENNCHAGMSSWLLDCNGDVYTCCGGYYSSEKEKFLLGNLRLQSFDVMFLSEQTREIYENVVKKCAGCAIPCDIEREVTEFGYSTEYTLGDVEIFRDEVKTACHMEEICCDNFNWHDLERDDFGSYRWMRGKSASVFLKVPFKYTNVRVSFRNVRAEGTEKFWLRGSINGVNLGEYEFGIGEQECDFALDKASDLITAGELIKFTMETNLEWIPKETETGSEDIRKLGIMVRRVEILGKNTAEENITDELSDLQKILRESEADRAARLDAINDLEERLRESEADRAARLDAINDLEERLRESEADRAARLDVINDLEKCLRESEADRAARLDVINDLEERLRESEADRTARLDVIHDLEKRLRESEEVHTSQLGNME